MYIGADTGFSSGGYKFGRTPEIFKDRKVLLWITAELKNTQLLSLYI